MGNKLNNAILSAAIILISLGVTVVRADPGSPESLGPGLVLIVVGACLGIVWKEYFKQEIRKEMARKEAQ